MSQSPSSYSRQPWADVIASDRGEFMRAFAHGDVRTDDIDAPSLANVQSPSTQAVTGTFTPGSGTLTVLGDSLDNSVVFSRTAAGQILVNGGAVENERTLAELVAFGELHAGDVLCLRAGRCEEETEYEHGDA